MANIDLHNLYQDFQKAFPFEKLDDMTLEQYTNLHKSDSFCYWLEFKTKELGSIRGGSAHKFRIFEWNKKPTIKPKYISDNRYSWHESLGTNKNNVFDKLKSAIIKIATASRNGEFHLIDDVSEFGDVCKWKIAFLYSNEKLAPIYRKDYLLIIANRLGKVFKDSTPISEIQKFIVSQQGSKDIYLFYGELLELLKSENETDIRPNNKNHIGEPKFWWLTANPTIWSLTNMKVGEEEDYTLYNENGNQRKIFQNFLDARPGDVVIGYEANPKKKIVAIAEISREQDGKTILFRKTESLINPIDLATIKNDPELAEMQFIKNPNGSFFRLTKKEYEKLIQLIRQTNPIQQTNKETMAYNKTDFLAEVFMSDDDFTRLERLLRRKKNIILQGAPGVGKTFTAKRLAYAMMGEKDEARVESVQFHQNYSYEDFIMGYKPDENSFSLRHGIFYEFCRRAANDPSRDYFFIIDEINRGNLSKIFGELLQLIEADYRKMTIRLAYSKDEVFSVPENLFIIGMMNTADRSLAMIDYALRRRFGFFDMNPGFDTKGFAKYSEAISSPYFNKLVEAVKSVNIDILKDDTLGKGFLIGHSYLIQPVYGDERDKNLFDFGSTENIIEYDLIPLLSEYWFDNKTQLNAVIEKLRKVLK